MSNAHPKFSWKGEKKCHLLYRVKSKDTSGPEVQKMFCFRVGGTKLKGSRAGLSGPDRVCIFEARPRRREPLSLHILISVVSKSYDNGSCVCQVLCVFYPELSLGQT